MKTWSECSKGEVHAALYSYLEELKRSYWETRVAWAEIFLGMYGDQDSVGVCPSRANAPVNPIFRSNHLTLNVSRAITDTAHAQLTQARPRPFLLTSGGDWSLQRKAERKQKFIDGKFDEERVNDLHSQALLDALVLGTGVIKISDDGESPSAERVLCTEILVDEALGYNQKPNELFQVKEVSRSSLLKSFPGHKESIQSLMAVSQSDWRAYQSDLVEVYEAWHLPFNDKPGRHVILTANAVLYDGPWEKEYFPFVFHRWSVPSVGFFGVGIPQQILGMQIEINRVARSISRAIDLIPRPRILLPIGGEINPKHVTNEIGSMMHYKPPFEPKFITPSAMPSEVYVYLETMIRRCFEFTGVSQQTAFAKKEPGITAAKAIRELSDLQSSRLGPQSQRYEEAFVETARQFLDICDDIVSRGGKISVRVGSQRGVFDEIDYSDIQIPSDKFTVQIFPTNFLGRTPSSRWNDVQDLMNAGMIDKPEAKRLMEYPDLKSVFDLENSALDNFARQVELILDQGLYLDPQPFDDLALGIKYYRNAYNKARIDGAPETALTMLRDWITNAQQLLAMTQAPMAPQQEGVPNV